VALASRIMLSDRLNHMARVDTCLSYCVRWASHTLFVPIIIYLWRMNIGADLIFRMTVKDRKIKITYLYTEYYIKVRKEIKRYHYRV
jgi:hypothetical protein